MMMIELTSRFKRKKLFDNRRQEKILLVGVRLKDNVVFKERIIIITENKP